MTLQLGPSFSVGTVPLVVLGSEHVPSAVAVHVATSVVLPVPEAATQRLCAQGLAQQPTCVSRWACGVSGIGL